MKTKRPPANALTADEFEFIFEHGYMIHCKWISPMERYQFSVDKMGHSGKDTPSLAYRKSLRAAYNFIRQREAKTP